MCQFTTESQDIKITLSWHNHTDNLYELKVTILQGFPDPVIGSLICDNHTLDANLTGGMFQ